MYGDERGNWTLTGGRADLPAAARWAREAEDAGFDAVMVSEHIVLGPGASAAGVMGNPRVCREVMRRVTALTS